MPTGRFEVLVSLPEHEIDAVAPWVECSRAEFRDGTLRLSFRVACEGFGVPDGLPGAFEVTCEDVRDHRVRLGGDGDAPEVVEGGPLAERAAGAVVGVYVHGRPADPDAAALALLVSDSRDREGRERGFAWDAQRVRDVLGRGYGLLCEVPASSLQRVAAALDAAGVVHHELPREGRPPEPLRLLAWGDSWVVARDFVARDVDGA